MAAIQRNPEKPDYAFTRTQPPTHNNIVQQKTDSKGGSHGKRVGFWLGLIAFIVIILIPGPADLSRAGCFVFALLVLMVCWWISEALPIVLTVCAASTLPKKEKKNFTLAALLGTAWAASIGGIGTPVGTTPNLIIIGSLESQGDLRFSFLR